MYPYDFCHQPAVHLTDSGQAIVCDECILSGKLAFCGLTEPAKPGIDASTIGVRAMKTALIAVFLLTGILVGCDHAKVQASASPKPHYTVVAGTKGLIAIREDTGQSCKTVNVWCADKEGNMVAEGLNESGISCAVLIELPTCDKLR